MLGTLLFISLMIILVFRRKIFSWLLLFIVHRLMKKIQEGTHQTKQSKQEESNKNTYNEMGEYIDYEEID